MIKRNAIFVEEEDMERILTQKLERSHAQLFKKCEETGHFSRCCLSKKKPKEGDAGRSAVLVEESNKDDTEEAVSFFGFRPQSENDADYISD